MQILLTAGPTHEPIDPVRFLGNRSSGRMGAAIAQAAIEAGHSVTLILGPATVAMPEVNHLIEVQTAADMLSAVLREWPNHDILIMAAAVADFRPRLIHTGKLPRHGDLTIECEATEDIAAAAAMARQPRQRIIGFSLESEGNIQRAQDKLKAKNLDLIVYNPPATIGSDTVEAVLIYPDGRVTPLPSSSKQIFAQTLIEHIAHL